MAKAPIKLNKKHEGKEFSNTFRFIGKVNPVRTKDDATDSWVDVPFYSTKKTRTNKDRRILQFNVETAERNELKVELAGMEKPEVYVYSRTAGNARPVAWESRFDKKAYPDESYHLIAQEWDKASDLGDWIEEGIWVDVRGSYEFSSFTNEDGETINMRKRIINDVYPLKNGEVIITGTKDKDTFVVHNQEKDGLQLGYGKADKDTATIKVGYLNPEGGGKLYLSKLDEDGNESPRKEFTYTDGTVEEGSVAIKNNLDSEIMIQNNGKRETYTYVRDFRSEDFFEVNTFEMQVGIRSTYQDENTKDTTINGVFLSYGKERSQPNDLEMIVYYKEAEEGKTPFADAFARLSRLDFLKVKGIDNNRATFGLVEVADEEDNPFEDVGEREVNFERINTGTKKGLEVLSYLTGTFQRGLLTEEEITAEVVTPPSDPFASTEINDDDLPF
ncbi:hypothetical protein ACI2JA_03570 [Alkalihalobacillus sp. NPDC078783]